MIKRPTLVLIVLAVVIAGLLGLVVWDANQPLTGDWTPGTEITQGRVRLRLKRVVIHPWSQPIPEVKGYLTTALGQGTSREYFLYLELGVYVDGLPIVEAVNGGLHSTGPLVVQYNGRSTSTYGAFGTYPGDEKDSSIHFWSRINPWARGFGPGELTIRQTVTLDDGSKETCEFRVPAH